MNKVLMMASVASMIDLFNMDNIKILKDLGYEIEVAGNFEYGSTTSQERVVEFRNELINNNYKIHHLPVPRSVFAISDIVKSYRMMKKLCDQNNYDIVHCQSPIGGIIARFACRKSRGKKTKVIYTAHGFHFYQGAPLINRLIYYPIEKLLSIYTDVLITIIKVFEWFSFRYRYYKFLLSEQDKYDFFLIRYSVHDVFQYFFLKKMKKPVFLVHHSIEVAELFSKKNLVGIVRGVLEKYFGKFPLCRAFGIISVTQEILDYEVSRSIDKQCCFIYPNGILYDDKIYDDKIYDDKICNNKSEIPEIIFVASNFAPWHGLDILLKDLKKNKQDFFLHLVGKINEKDLYVALKDPRVICHGELDQEQIFELSKKCWVGLSSFALFRNNMEEACTLKVREYLKLGLPVYAGHRDVFTDDFIFYKYGKPYFESIISFAKKHQYTDKKEISLKSQQYIDKKILLKKIYKELANI